VDSRTALRTAEAEILQLKGHIVDVIDVARPRDLQGALELARIISKLSPLVGNLLEYTVAQYLNASHTWPSGCRWVRQDPDFPDIVLRGLPGRPTGVEIKTWFPLATEITARFRDSQTILKTNHTKVAMVCWVPEHIVAGRPQIVDVWVDDAMNVAKARDTHYHSPPDYVVMEPEDTTARTRNLQQTNCTGHRFQGSSREFARAQAFVDAWGKRAKVYRPDRGYQTQLRQLTGRFPYRLDTNFAKMDRIVLPSLEEFKARVLQTRCAGLTLEEWTKALAREDPEALSALVDPSPPAVVG